MLLVQRLEKLLISTKGKHFFSYCTIIVIIIIIIIVVAMIIIITIIIIIIITIIIIIVIKAKLWPWNSLQKDDLRKNSLASQLEGSLFVHF